jgi:integrase
MNRAKAGSFREIAEDFINRYVVGTEKLRSKPEIEGCLKTYVYPRWEHLPFEEFRKSDVTRLLDQIEDEHGARQADVVLALIRKMMNWHATRADDYVSPVVRSMGRWKKVVRDRTLSESEIRSLWKACDRADQQFAALVKMLL